MKVNVIGAGYSSLAAACYLAKAGHEVSVFEKNPTIGGRSRQYSEEGFTFDMGPSWYWMPDVFERFFNDFGKSAADYYELLRIAPSYRVYFGERDYMDMPTSVEEMYALFEAEEQGAGKALEKFLAEAEHNYGVAIKDLVYRPGLSPLELVTKETVKKVGLFLKNIQGDVRARFKSPKLRSILEFPVLFLGAKPDNTPAFYNFMNYADIVLGTWHPKGGMFEVVKAMHSLGESLGVTFRTDAGVEKIVTVGNRASGIIVDGEYIESDMVVSGADYAHTETLLDAEHRVYSKKYWDSRVFAPSALCFYVGIEGEVEEVLHHNLFFDVPFGPHAAEIYDVPKWPTDPLFYASFPSKTDKEMAPEGKENAFFLIPIAAGIEDSEERREEFFQVILDRIKALTGISLAERVVYKRSYCLKDFISDYNSYKGNAYGMANTLKQTAFLRPRIKSKKVEDLYFTGQLTVPGPGVPPSLISGKIVADKIAADIKGTRHESAIR